VDDGRASGREKGDDNVYWSRYAVQIDSNSLVCAVYDLPAISSPLVVPPYSEAIIQHAVSRYKTLVRIQM
jgi:hypothetical protein